MVCTFEHPWKAEFPSEVMLDDISIVLSVVIFWKALFPMVDTFVSTKDPLTNSELLKAYVLMVVTELGIVDGRFLQ